ncbi:MAG: Hsp20/alpha crystallin family protein [Anaerovoracaceae bacterium]|jgi:HSP20 family protein
MFDLMPFERSGNSIFNYLDNLEKNFFGDLSTDVSQFRTDVIERDDHFELKADLPGFKKEDISVDLDNDILRISAEHKEENEEKDENEKYVRRERRYGKFVRNFDVTGIDTDNIEASYDNGVLSLKLPKEKESIPETKQIEVK